VESGHLGMGGADSRSELDYGGRRGDGRLMGDHALCRDLLTKIKGTGAEREEGGVDEGKKERRKRENAFVLHDRDGIEDQVVINLSWIHPKGKDMPDKDEKWIPRELEDEKVEEWIESTRPGAQGDPEHCGCKGGKRNLV
jgi:hypothetical protein